MTLDSQIDYKGTCSATLQVSPQWRMSSLDLKENVWVVFKERSPSDIPSIRKDLTLQLNSFIMLSDVGETRCIPSQGHPRSAAADSWNTSCLPSTCHTRACHRGRTEIFCCIYVWHSWKKKKKSKTTINHHTQSAIPWETLWLWPSLQTGNAHLKRPEWTSTQEATTLWTCSNRRVLERETKPFGSEWSWCVEKLCINASDTQWRLTKKGNGHLAFPVKGLSSWAIPTSEMKSHHGLQPAEPGTQRQTYGTVQSHLSWYVWLTLDF